MPSFSRRERTAGGARAGDADAMRGVSARGGSPLAFELAPLLLESHAVDFAVRGAGEAQFRGHDGIEERIRSFAKDLEGRLGGRLRHQLVALDEDFDREGWRELVAPGVLFQRIDVRRQSDALFAEWEVRIDEMQPEVIEWRRAVHEDDCRGAGRGVHRD